MIRLKRPPIAVHAGSSMKPERLGGGHYQLEKRAVTSNATELALKGGRGGTIPPVKHRFKPGPAWRGNAGGRPKILGGSLTKQLKAKTEDGRTVAEKVVENLINNALSRFPHSVTAFRTIREIVEPNEEEERVAVDRDLVREMTMMFMEREVEEI